VMLGIKVGGTLLLENHAHVAKDPKKMLEQIIHGAT